MVQLGDLQKLQLRKFNGNPMEWYAFWESFESVVRKNPSSSEVEKFNYLKSYLEGGAVSGLSLTNDNCRHAVELLKTRFGDRQVIGASHMESLTRLYGCFLTPVIMQRIPEEIRIIISRGLPSEAWVLKDVMEALNKELKLREQCSSTKPKEEQAPFSGSSRFNSRSKNPHSSATLLSENSS